MRLLFVPLTLGVSATLLIVSRWPLYPGLLTPPAVILLTSALAAYGRRAYRLCYLLLSLTLALLMGDAYLNRFADYRDRRQLDIPETEYIDVEGTVCRYPKIGADRSRIDLKTTRLDFNRKVHHRRLRVRITVMGALEGLYRGQRIRIAARLYRPRLASNFADDRLARYAFTKGIHFYATCKSAQLVETLSPAPFIWRCIGKWRDRLRRIIRVAFPDSIGEISPAALFFEAVLLGDRSRMGAREREIYLAAGVFHLFAISGAHIAVIAFLSMVALRWLGVGLRSRSAATLLLLALFVTVSDFTTPAVRAVLMAVLVLTARVFRYKFHAYNLLAFCALMLLMINPAALLDAGFVLTFVLTAAVINGQRIFAPVFSRLPLQLGAWISVSLSAAMAAVPLSLFFFSRASLVGWMSGLILIPLVSPAIMMGILALMAAPLAPAVAGVLLKGAGISFALFHRLIECVTGWVRASIYRPPPPFALLLAFLALTFLWGECTGKKRRWSALLALGCLVVMLLPFARYRPETTEVYVLDVGQGSAAVVVFPDGNSLLVDGGGDYRQRMQVGKQVVLPFLLRRRIRVTWIAVTHYHPDHCRGVSEIIEILRPRELWLSSKAEETSCYQDLLKNCPSGVTVRYLSAGFQKRAGAGCRIQLLFPPRVIASNRSLNNHSQVFRIVLPESAVLLPGDIEMAVESSLVDRYGSALRSDILLIPHHGSGSSSSPRFIDAVAPRLTIVSAGRANRFVHPHPDIRARYINRGIPVLTTAEKGAIRLRFSKGAVQINVSR